MTLLGSFSENLSCITDDVLAHHTPTKLSKIYLFSILSYFYQKVDVNKEIQVENFFDLELFLVR